MKKRKKATPQRAANSSRSTRKPAGRARSKSAAARTKASSVRAKGLSTGVDAVSAMSFALTGECVVADATALKDKLEKLLVEPQTVTLDVSELRRIDTAALQVIAAFVRERDSHGRETAWQGSAPALNTAAHLLGLTPLLKLPADVAQPDVAP